MFYTHKTSINRNKNITHLGDCNIMFYTQKTSSNDKNITHLGDCNVMFYTQITSSNDKNITYFGDWNVTFYIRKTSKSNHHNGRNVSFHPKLMEKNDKSQWK